MRAWLTRHSRWTFHFTPISASWLNALEGFFSTLTRRRLKRSTSTGVVDLQAAIKRYIAEAGIEPSVGSVGDSYDNALAETVIGLSKTEVIHRRGPWRSFEAVAFATLEWVDRFDHRRRLEPIGNVPPAEAEARYYGWAPASAPRFGRQRCRSGVHRLVED